MQVYRSKIIKQNKLSENYIKKINTMYNTNNPPNRASTIQMPQHIAKLLQKIKDVQGSNELEKILVKFLPYSANDDTLLSIFHYFRWDDSVKKFTKEIDQAKLISVIREKYDFPTEEGKTSLLQDNEDENINKDHLPILKHDSMLIHQTQNSNLSDSVFIRNENSDLFMSEVKKPIPRQNSQQEGNFHYTDQFLTESGKNIFPELLRGEDSAIVNNWKTEGSRPITLNSRKTPNFLQDSNFTFDETKKSQKMKLHDYHPNIKYPGNPNHGYDNFKEQLRPSNNHVSTFQQTKVSSFQKNVYVPDGSNSIPQEQSISHTLPPSQFSFLKPEKNINPNDHICIPQKRTRNPRKVVKQVKTQRILVHPKKKKTLPEDKLNKKQGGRHQGRIRHSKLNQVRNSSFGLKEISKKVKEIVKKMGRTTYKEISDTIVNEINQKDSKDEKNIRRRIYDSLNVMKSMNMFKKDKISKTIIWNSKVIEDDNQSEMNDNEEEHESYFNSTYKSNYPYGRDYYYSNSTQEMNIALHIKQKQDDIKRKYQTKETVECQFKYLNELISRNRLRKTQVEEVDKIRFPFLIIEFPDSTGSNISITANEQKNQLHFSFDYLLKIYSDLHAISKISKNSKDGLNSLEIRNSN